MGNGFAQEQDPIVAGVGEAADRCATLGIDFSPAALQQAEAMVRGTIGELGQPTPLAINLFSQVVTTATLARSVNGEPDLGYEDIMLFGTGMRALMNSWWHEL